MRHRCRLACRSRTRVEVALRVVWKSTTSGSGDRSVTRRSATSKHVSSASASVSASLGQLVTLTTTIDG